MLSPHMHQPSMHHTGLASTADSDGFFAYSRPEGKSGGHGVREWRSEGGRGRCQRKGPSACITASEVTCCLTPSQVGWSEIPRYTFKVPAGWAEIPVSIADLGGTEVSVHVTRGLSFFICRHSPSRLAPPPPMHPLLPV
jgi:hypothetical protein